MRKGNLKSFVPENGFGVIRLDDEVELPFDIAASNKRTPAVGEVCEVEVGTNYKGQPKAKLVLFEVEEDGAPSFKKGFQILKDNGFCSGWDAKSAQKSLEENDTESSKMLRATFGALIALYYEEGLHEKGTADRVLWIDWRFGSTTQTIAEDLTTMSGMSLAASTNANNALVNGKQLDLASEAGLMPLLQALNSSLEGNGEPGRFFSLDTDSDSYLIVYREKSFDAEIGKISFFKLG